MGPLEALGKTKMEQLIYDVEPLKTIPGDFEERIENSFKELTAKLESLYKEVDKDDNRLFDILADFAQVHDDIYFETGFFTGVKLVKRLESKCEKNEYDDLGKKM